MSHEELVISELEPGQERDEDCGLGKGADRTLLIEEMADLRRGLLSKLRR